MLIGLLKQVMLFTFLKHIPVLIKSQTICVLKADECPSVLLSPGEAVGADPGVWDGDSRGDAQTRQISRHGALQQIRVTTHRILRLTHV